MFFTSSTKQAVTRRHPGDSLAVPGLRAAAATGRASGLRRPETAPVHSAESAAGHPGRRCRASGTKSIVDEFQDINHLDFVFVEAIARKAVLVVTGDDDQAIYGFRGCTPDYIIDLEKHLGRPLESHELQINYRCPPLIVSTPTV